jgi:hypothetical protein
MAYVYRHIRLDKNEPFYIGVSSDCDILYKRAYKKLGRNEYWQRIISKTNYRVDILFDEVDFGFAKEKEMELIKLYGRQNLNNGILCNLTDGGEGTLNMVFSDEHRLKISSANKGRSFSEIHKKRLSESAKNRSEAIINIQRERFFNLGKNNKGKKQSLECIEKRTLKLKGKKRSQEIKDKLSLAFTGRKMSVEARKKMSESAAGKHIGLNNGKSKIVLNTQNGVFYYSISEAAQSMGIKRTTLAEKLNGNIKNNTYLTLA